MEVNSAISLAIQGLDIKNQATNFNDSKIHYKQFGEY